MAYACRRDYEEGSYPTSVSNRDEILEIKKSEQKATPSGILKISPSFATLSASNLEDTDSATENEGHGHHHGAQRKVPPKGHGHHHGVQRKVPTKGSRCRLSTSPTKTGAPLHDALLPGELERSRKTFIEQLTDWVHNERDRRRALIAKREAKRLQQNRTESEAPATDHFRRRSSNASSISSLSVCAAPDESLDQLERIIAENLSLGPATASESHPIAQITSKRPSLSRKISSGKIKAPGTPYRTSDTDIRSDGGTMVPSCEVHLGIPEDIGMDQFKCEILKLAHTLRCKGWKRINLQDYKSIDVKRISGALTNAVYMVSPPANLHLAPKSSSDSSTTSKTHRSPEKLLLRIYGPQVAHLIDRNVELSILHRLGRKKIGPSLLGTFENGRFEQFFNAKTLTRDDIRIPEISIQIAKRMRELHDGMELEEEERRRGPVVWLNWKKWIKRTRDVMQKIDAETDIYGKGEYLCGLPWSQFEIVVERYRAWQTEKHGGHEEIKKRLVFAHNDTQYGNILRIIPSGDSPLLLPSNEHKRLVVIDFEYASANVPGFEFANHFCEWMANYHDPKKPYLLRESDYPTLEQQELFIRSYVEHRLYTTPHPLTRVPNTANTDNSSAVSITSPVMTRSQSQSHGFSLDSGMEYKKEEEAVHLAKVENEVQKLLEETNVWRPASSAVWCAWGIVQAKLDDSHNKENIRTDDGTKQDKSPEESMISDAETDEFNYLRYAQQRALLFLGDMLELGIMNEEELGEKVLWKVKRIKF